MTIPELQALARAALDFGITRIRETKGDLLMQFHLIAQDNRQEIYIVGDGLYDKPGKTAMAEQIRSRVAQGDIEAVIMLSDAYWCDDMTPEADKLRRLLGMELDQAAKAGLCTIKEAVIVTLESPIYNESLRQQYKRVDGAIELVGEPRTDGEVVPSRSRMTGWFNTSEAGGVQ